MKPLFVSLSVLSLAVLVGCDSGHTGPTNQVGGPAATATSNRSGVLDSVVGLKDNEFKLSPPTLATDIKQGEEKSVDIGIKRGKGFDQDVALSFTGEDGKSSLPKGLKVVDLTPSIKKGDEKTSVKFKAADDAATNTFTLKVTGKPATGPSGSADFKVKVEKK